METYTIEITETLQKQIKVLAESEDKAREIAQEVYYSGDEYLTENDLKETTFEIIEEE